MLNKGIKLKNNSITKEQYISLVGGRIHAIRCQALSKRSKLQCKKAALKGKYVCMFHGGNYVETIGCCDKLWL